MSTPLTDGINALTQYANEITGKSDTTLSDVVGSLVEGYGQGGFNPFAYVSDMGSMFIRVNNLPETLEIDFSGNTTLTSMQNAFSIQNTGLKHLIIKNLVSSSTTIKMAELLYANNTIQTIEFRNCDFSPRTINRAFAGRYLTDIIGEIDMTNVVANSVHHVCDTANLREVRLKANSLCVNCINGEFSVCSLLSDASLVSIANGLSPDSTGNTITLHATAKSNCSSITGTNDNGTFVADENGTLTLADFITTIKGWTLA